MQKKRLFVIILICSLCTYVTARSVNVSENEVIPGPKLIRQYGYPFEQHEVTTSDGYILQLYRIPHGKDKSSEAKGEPVFLMHGLLSAAENWLITDPQSSIAYLLADMGMDVWMGNARGTRHSRRHVKLDPDKDKEFWDFSFHEIGVYDLPASIDYVLQKTSSQQLTYLGHSQGTTVFFVMASEKPEYNNKIKLSVTLAPVAYLSNLTSPLIKLLVKFSKVIEILFSILNIYELLPRTINDILLKIGPEICKQGILREICANVLFLVGGYDSEQMDRALVPKIVSVLPAGISTKQLIHFAQEIKSGHFRQFDYGLMGNIARYKRFTPPDYNLKNVKAPVAIFCSKNDPLADLKDTEKLSKELPNVVVHHLVPYKQFTHLDYMWASDVYDLLYRDVLNLVEKYIG